MLGKIEILSPDIADLALDARGAIFSFLPKSPIVEFVYIDTKQGVTRGHHFHKEFDEYILMVQGEGVYIEPLDNGQNRKIVVGAGTAIYIPKFTPHTFVPLTDCKSVSMLTRAWDDCAEPITKYPQ